MGQDQSAESRPQLTNEELSRQLADKFASRCFTSLELYSLKDNFKTLADHEHDVRYLKESTIARFLEIPDILGASPVLFHIVSHLGAFPFLKDAPAVLELEKLVIVITLLTDRYRQVLKRGSTDRMKLLFKSLAVYDRKLSEIEQPGAAKEKNISVPSSSDPAPTSRHATGFAIDEPGEDQPEDSEAGLDDDDDLVLAAFESLDCVEAFRSGGVTTIHGAMIPADNFRKLVMLLLLVAPLDPQERLSLYSARVAGEELESMRETAECVLAAVYDEQSPGIKFSHFKKVLPVSFPFLFDGFTPLFTHFLFSKNLDLGKRKGDDGKGEGDEHDRKQKPAASPLQVDVAQPLLQDTGAIMNANVLSQLSFFIPGSDIFRRLRLLYSGDDDGFSMGSFETKVFNWRAPTILLVRGSRLGAVPDGAQESTFASSLPPRRFPHGGRGRRNEGEGQVEEDDNDPLLTFGAYVPQPWRLTHRECFGGDDTILFQLGPVHDVFRASSLNKDYVAFVRPSASIAPSHAGVSFGCPPPASATSKTTVRHHSGVSASVTQLGSVSLFLDSGLEFGVFTHDFGARGGAFANSGCRSHNFQERFRIESLEVWGCGGNEEAKAQAERWAWEAKEAEARRRINLGTGDIDADRALLEMAGLIGQNRSGGSMA